jgi:hypothetical protein
MGKGGLVTYDNGDFFKILFRLHGSIFDNVAVKLCVVIIISFTAALLQSQLGWFMENDDLAEFYNEPERQTELLASGNWGKELTGKNGTRNVKVLIGYTMPTINSIGFTISGGAIAFLLVFRSVLSYNRFWEGRGHLGYIMAHARDLARQVAFSFKDDDGDPNIFRNVKTFEREMHENRTRPDYGTYHDQEGVREALIGMYGFRRMRMMRCCVMFWRLLIQHLRDEVSPTKVRAAAPLVSFLISPLLPVSSP